MRTSGPEKIVEAEIRSWGARNGFDLTVVDTSAVWNPQAGRYISRQASESLPDLIGNHGPLSVWIELKAPGSRSAINSRKNLHQREFLIRKIKQGCFAVVTDSVSHIEDVWLRFRRAELFDKAAVLINDLPVTRITRLSSPRDIVSKKLK